MLVVEGSEDPGADTEPAFDAALARLELPEAGATAGANARLSALIRAGPRRLTRGAQLGRYVVLDELGRGGMGAVYAAYDPQLDRRVAIKVLLHPYPTPEANARLLEEARALARLRHPNVVTIHDVGERDGTPFLAMEFIEGPTLRDWLAEQTRGWREVVAVMRAAGRGLAAAHAAGIVHRDFKPANVMLEAGPPSEAPARVIVMDFGLARRGVTVSSDSGSGSEPLSDGHLTPAGTLLGTPAYMSSEQFHDRPVGPRSDQFSYCVTFYEALFGERPFDAGDVYELATVVGEGRIRPVRSDTDVPRWLVDILHQGLRNEADERYPSMDELLRAIDRGAGRRRRTVIGLGVAATVGIAAVLGFRSPPADACDRENAALHAAWSDERGDELAVAFEATGHPSAGSLWPRSRAAMDHFVTDWTDEYRNVCSSWETTLPPALLEARRACLVAERDHFLALLDAFAKPTRATVGVAFAATKGLPVPGDCAEIDSMDAVPPEGWTQEILAAQSTLARALARDSVGDTNGARALLAEAREKLGDLDAPHTRAEISKADARLLFRSGEFEAGETAITRAQELAAQSKDARLVADVWMARVSMLRTYRPDDPELPHLVVPAELAVAFAGNPDSLVAALKVSEGMAKLDAGDADGALRSFDAGIEVASHGGVGPRTIANLYDNSGRAYSLLGEPDRALESSRQALKIIVDAWGPAHPAAVLFHQNVATPCVVVGDIACARKHVAAASEILDAAGDESSMRRATNLGFWAQVELADGDHEAARRYAEAAVAMLTALGRENSPPAFNPVVILHALAIQGGRFEDAVRLARHILTITTREYGPTHPDVAWAQGALGEALRDAGHRDEAIEALQTAVQTYEQSTAPQDERARTMVALAQLLWLTDRDRPRAERLVRRAYTEMPTGTAGEEARQELRTWLVQRDLPPPADPT